MIKILAHTVTKAIAKYKYGKRHLLSTAKWTGPPANALAHCTQTGAQGVYVVEGPASLRGDNTSTSVCI